MSSYKVHSTLANAENLRLHMMFKDTHTGLTMAQGLHLYVQHMSICDRSSLDCIPIPNKISAFYTLSYLQLYNIVDFRSYFIFLYMPDHFIELCSSKLFICVYVCESVSKLSHRQLVLNYIGITQFLISHYIELFRF